jgi:regulator of cell morphogenesis and NO signaling
MTTITVTRETPVGRIAAAAPSATRVFARHGIDFCCAGSVPLEDACAERDLDVATVLDEILRETAAEAPVAEGWENAPLEAVIDHILATYHRPLDEELPRIEAMAGRVYEVHGSKDPERLGEIVRVYGALKADLEPHMQKEEAILFPMIRQGMGRMADGPVAVMRSEHDEAGALLRRLRELTDGYAPPASACNTWRALYHALSELEASLHEHIHLENNVLFPRALDS